MKFKKICILRLSAIGDVCNAIITYQLIKRAYPNIEITWIVGKVEAEVLKPFDDLNLIIFNKKNGIKEYFRIWKELKQNKFNVLLNMQTAIRASFLSLGIKAVQKVGFNTDRSREGQKFFINQKIEIVKSPHVVDGFIAFAKFLGIKPLNIYWDYPISNQLIDEVKPFLIKDNLNILIAPCSSKAEKDWTVDGYISIIKYLQQYNYNIIISGSNNPREVAFINKIINATSKVINLVGKTTIPELISLIKQVDLVISPDSAAVHMANMVETEVIGLYAYHNPKRTGPYNQLENVISVYEKNVKYPIDKLPWATKAKGDNLMQQIKPQQVIEKINQLLKIK